MSDQTARIVIFVILLTYFFFNISFLTEFPFIHSDESWLSGLSRNMIAKKDLSVTEPFFDLYPRYPHSVKTIFHLIQILFIKISGYNIFTFRLISLITGTLTLYIFYRLCLLISHSHILSIAGLILLGTDIQYIYASHFARQEIILVLILVSALYIFYRYKINSGHRSSKSENNITGDLLVGTITGLGIGIHPNIFVISLPIIIIYLFNLFVRKKIKIINFVVFTLTLASFAVFFILLSLSFDPQFISHYAAYGKSLGVLNSILVKLDRLDYFYLKLFYGISGTYYTPYIKVQFILFGLIFIFSVINNILFRERNNKGLTLSIMLAIIGINLGYILIGRYNQTGIIFIFPLFYLLLIDQLSFITAKLNIKAKFRHILLAFFVLLNIFNTTYNLFLVDFSGYDSYLNEISRSVKRNNTVLANLNTEYYFENGKIYDYRNLGRLKKEGLTFDDYIKKNQIEYIIYPEEMDFIYNTRPVWNGLYGNMVYYHQDMKNFLENNCLLIKKFNNKNYGMRIARYIGKKDWQIRIYKVLEYD